MNISEQYAESITEQLAKIKNDIDRVTLEAKATAEKSSREHFFQVIEEIRVQHKELERKINELESAGHENWHELVDMVIGIQHDMEDAISHVKLH